VIPIEREFKYILGVDHPDFEKVLTKAARGIQAIQQGYLNKGGRVRSIQPLNKKLKPKGQPRYLFTYKHDLLDKSGILEIECPISKSDFDLAWRDAQQRVTKTRHDLPFGEHVWEVDRLMDGAGVVFLMLAECEVDPAEGRPKVIHPLVAGATIYEVVENDARFTNRKLSDPAYTKALIAEVTQS
jgi:CYTH domain-containing protein